MSEGLNIYQRLHAVMGEIDYIQKEKKQGMRYSIVSHDKVTAAVRPLLHKHGIVYNIEKLDFGQDGNRTWVKIVVCFTNVDDIDDTIHAESFGYGVDDQDKGPGKAMSYAMKYALLKTLGLETGDEPAEHDVPDDEVDEVQDERAKFVPEKPPSSYVGTRLIHPDTPKDSKNTKGRGPSSYSAKDSPLFAQLAGLSSLDAVEDWWMMKQPDKAGLPWGHQIDLFEKMIQQACDVAESTAALNGFISKHMEDIKAMEDVDRIRGDQLFAYAKNAKAKFSEAGR